MTVSTEHSRAEASQPSATQWISMLARGELTARELAEHYLKRIADVDERLHAVVAIEPEVVLERADEADLARRAGDRRPLLGLPVTIKDSIDVAGLPCTGGSFARAGYVPDHDATVVRRLRDAGAIVLAKSNVPEYSSAYETDNAVHGRTNHPEDPARTPGGSSGGEAALAGADATPLGIGTDGGGSLRVPAHYCGVVGLRPTVGRVPDTGTWPRTRAGGYMDLFCVGPMARFTEDIGLVLPVISGPDWHDPYAVPAPLGDPAAVSLSGLRVGVFVDDPRLSVTCGTLAALARAARVLSEAGAAVEEVSAPWEEDPTELFFACVAADGGAQVRADLAPAWGRHHPLMSELLDAVSARRPSAAEWFGVQARVFALRATVRALAGTVDVLLCPVVAGPAPHHGQPPGGLPPESYGEFRAFDYVHLMALGGLPAASVPAGREDGLPVGVQVAAAPYREDLVLAAAAALEAAAL
ncbi:MAG TPA: amidase [Solirubrobacteraceae bacterium]|nr:amidase [Solirubrobacteraceae bacterium]